MDGLNDAFSVDVEVGATIFKAAFRKGFEAAVGPGEFGCHSTSMLLDIGGDYADDQQGITKSRPTQFVTDSAFAK